MCRPTAASGCTDDDDDDGDEARNRVESTDIAKAIVGRNECTRMPPDSAAAKAGGGGGGGRERERSIKSETRPTRSAAASPMAVRADAREVTDPSPHSPPSAQRSRDLRGGGELGSACNKMSVHEGACVRACGAFRAIDECCGIFLACHSFEHQAGCHAPC